MSSAVLLVSCALLGGLVGYNLFENHAAIFLFAFAGLMIGLIALQILRIWLKVSASRVIGGTVGIMVGAILGNLVNWGLWQNIQQPELSLAVYGIIMVIFCLVGMELGSVKAKELVTSQAASSGRQDKTIGILDTSVIIDGRIADVCETGFLDGHLIIPQFVLKELQAIADSSESTKRTRGRRGLDILNKIQKQAFVKIIIDDTDYPSVKEVDQKLITMAKEKGHAILTNDFNLNKVAEVHSLAVLNINQLANSLKPIVLPGETMKVQIMKEGKEHAQGVAYLDDGTMVVIDNGKKYMGKTMDVTVTSVLQTTAGRMIFAVVKI
jgi:uncharacterized protein YacL